MFPHSPVSSVGCMCDGKLFGHIVPHTGVGHWRQLELPGAFEVLKTFHRHEIAAHRRLSVGNYCRIVGMKRRLGLHGNLVASPAPPRFTRSPSDDGAHTGRPTAMAIIGLDLHKRETQLSIKADDGTITDRRITTNRERFTAVFGERPRPHPARGEHGARVGGPSPGVLRA